VVAVAVVVPAAAGSSWSFAPFNEPYLNCQSSKTGPLGDPSQGYKTVNVLIEKNIKGALH
jgi:hypothetical protein